MTTLRSYEPAEDESVEPDVVIVINGFGCVGKTTLCLGLAGGDLHSEYLPTVSDVTRLVVPLEAREQPVIVEIRDTAGQEDYDRLRPLSYAGTNCFICLYCFEAPREESYSWSSAQAVQKGFIAEMQHHCPDTPIVIMKNKSDLLRNEGFIHTNEDVESDCKWIKHRFEGSVFDGEGVNEMFEKAVSLALEHKETRKGNLRRPAGKKCAVS